jgi:hypothetical protein
MGNGLAKVVRLSALVVAGGALSFAVFFSNCGGSDGMRTGAAGTTGAGGGAGASGSGGSGTAGVTGTGGRFTCPNDQTLNCSAALTLTSGHVTTFSPEEWSPTDGKYCNASGLRGSVFSYSGGPAVDGGVMSSNAHGVDAPAGNFRLTLTAGTEGYAGGGISFDRCVNATASGALRFTAWVASGDIAACAFKAQLQTFEQRPTTQAPGGSCDPDAGSCYGFPSATVTLTSSPTPITIPFADFTGATHAAPIAGQIVGLQWQLESGAPTTDGGLQADCTAEIRIDEIDFVTP